MQEIDIATQVLNSKDFYFPMAKFKGRMSKENGIEDAPANDCDFLNVKKKKIKEINIATYIRVSHIEMDFMNWL